MSHAKQTRRSFGRLRRLPSGRWQAAYTGPDGLVHKAGTTFEDEDSARAWLAAERRLVDLDAWTPPTERREARRAAAAAGGPTFAAFAADWLAARRTARGPLKPRTRADYQRLLDRHLLPAFGRRKVRAITAADVAVIAAFGVEWPRRAISSAIVALSRMATDGQERHPGEKFSPTAAPVTES